MVVIAAMLAAGCGGSAAGDPLLSGSVSGSYAGASFTPDFGFATIYQGTGLIGLADTSVHCGSEKSANPPAGHGVIISVPALAVGTYASTSVQVFSSPGGNYMSYGSSGDVTITAVTADSVAGTVSFTATDSQTGSAYAANGEFEVTNCPQ